VQVAGFGRLDLHDGEERASATRVRRGVHDGAAGLVRAERGRVDPRAGRNFDGVAAEGEQALLQTTEVLHARDDFLSGIAALLETDAADQVPVRLLRDEQVRRRRGDVRHARRDAVQTPRRFVHDARVPGERGLQHRGVAGGRERHEPAVAQRKDGGALADRHGAGRAGRDAECLARRGVGAFAGDADQRALRGDVLDRHLRAEHEHGEPPPNDLGEIRGEQHDDAVIGTLGRCAPQHAVGEHAALRRVVTPVLAVTFAERLDVARQLAVQERRRIGAGHAQYAKAGV
jgi:hypothetical protein